MCYSQCYASAQEAGTGREREMATKNQEFAVPEEMRAMLDKGVTQAREGFGKLMEAASEAAADVEAKADKTQAQLLDAQKKAMAFTEANVSAAFELAAKMVKAKTLEEMTSLQTQYMAAQFETLKGHAGDAAKLIQDHAKTATAELAAEAEKFQAKAREAVEKGMEAAKNAANTAKK